ncbi:MAG: DoxX family protein [bacterium]|nr:DoxX family protein [bacterium]
MMDFDISMLVLRLTAGFIFIAHGWPKVKGMKMTAQHFESMGFKPGHVWGTAVALVEFIGGIALILGFLAQPAAFAMAIVMLVALFWKLGKGQGLVGGYELDLVLLAVLITITLLDSGAYSMTGGYYY